MVVNYNGNLKDHGIQISNVSAHTMLQDGPDGQNGPIGLNARLNAEKDKKSVNESEIALVVLWVKLQDVHTKEMCNWNMVLVTFSAILHQKCS